VGRAEKGAEKGVVAQEERVRVRITVKVRVYG